MTKKPEYGTDSYNRPGKNKFIGPSRGIAGSLLQKKSVVGGVEQMRSSITKKQEQSLMKRHCKLIRLKLQTHDTMGGFVTYKKYSNLY